MRILALNGSPRAEKGATELLLRAFLDGAESAGAQTETIYLAKKNIRECIGCYSCWVKTPGVCRFKDDMPKLVEKMKQADLLVFATPLYIFTVTSCTKRCMERTLPLVMPYMIKHGSKHVHPQRWEKPTKLMLISVCGFPEKENFGALIQTMRMFAEGGGMEYIGEIVKPAGEMIKVNPLARGFLKYVKKAGEEVVKYGKVTEKTAKCIDSKLVPDLVLEKLANAWWNRQIKKSTLK